MKRRRVWWFSLVGVMLLPQSCVPAATAERPMLISHVEIDSTFAEFLAELRELLPTERVLCMYGAVSNDTAWLNFIKPAKMRSRTETNATYDSCPKPRTLSPIATYLGTWHNHNVRSVTWDDLCSFSETDTRSFNADKYALVDMLSCKGKLMARSKFK